ncbi:MAG: T9SS type A sorting domain-containing protein [Bacteroidota bacterium]
MKNLFLFSFIFLLFMAQSQAQFPLEHTYQFFVQRINIPNIGEKYLASDKVNSNLLLFNADHTPWKTIHIPNTPVNLDNLAAEIYDPYRINTDAQLEFFISYWGTDANGNYKNQSGIMNESGDLLLDGYTQFVRLPDGREKVISQSAKVYGLPGLVFEHDYNYSNIIYFKKVNSGTPKGYYAVQGFGASQYTIFIYDDVHDLVDSIKVPMPAGYNIGQYRVTDDIGDGTADLKCLLEINNNIGLPDRIWLIRQNGSELFSLDDPIAGGNMNIAFFEPGEAGLTEKKLIALIFGGGGFKERFYKLPGFELQQELSDFIIPYNVDGRFLWPTTAANDTVSALNLFSPDNWIKEYSIPKPAGIWWHVIEPSKFVFDSDPGFEIFMTESSNGQQYGNPIIRNDDGSVLFQENELTDGEVSHLPGYPNKLICYSGQPTNKFKIYTLPSSTPLPVINVSENRLDLNIVPNPSAGDVTLGFEKTPTGPVSVEIVSLQGARIATLEQAPSEKITLERALFPAPGLYFVSIRSEDWKGVAKVIIL